MSVVLLLSARHMLTDTKTTVPNTWHQCSTFAAPERPPPHSSCSLSFPGYSSPASHTLRFSTLFKCLTKGHLHKNHSFMDWQALLWASFTLFLRNLPCSVLSDLLSHHTCCLLPPFTVTESNARLHGFLLVDPYFILALGLVDSKSERRWSADLEICGSSQKWSLKW